MRGPGRCRYPRPVGRDQIVQHDGDRTVVDHHVVEHQREPVLLVGQSDQRRRHERSCFDVEDVGSGIARRGLRGRLRIPRRRDVDLQQADLGLISDDLHGRTVALGEGGPQALVVIRDVAQPPTVRRFRSARRWRPAG